MQRIKLSLYLHSIFRDIEPKPLSEKRKSHERFDQRN